MRFEARVRADLVGFNRLNPQLQEKVIELKRDRGHWRYSKARTHAKGKAADRAHPLGALVHEVGIGRGPRTRGALSGRGRKFGA